MIVYSLNAEGKAAFTPMEECGRFAKLLRLLICSLLLTTTTSTSVFLTVGMRQWHHSSVSTITTLWLCRTSPSLSLEAQNSPSRQFSSVVWATLDDSGGHGTGLSQGGGGGGGGGYCNRFPLMLSTTLENVVFQTLTNCSVSSQKKSDSGSWDVKDNLPDMEFKILKISPCMFAKQTRSWL